MSYLEVDFSEVSESQEALKEGAYKVQVLALEEKTGSESGKPYIEWKFKVTEGESEGHVLYRNTSLQKQALFGLYNMLTALGMNPSKTKSFGFDFNECVGRTCTAFVTRKLYKDKVRNEIESFAV